MAKKEIIDTFKIMAPGGSATPAPPLGPVLGAKGVNPGQFIQKFNAATAALKGKVVGCVVTVYNDKSFALEIKSSPASVLICEAAGIEKGASNPKTEKAGVLTQAKLKEVALAKMADLNTDDVEMAMRIVAGSARQMGVKVEG